jgi:3-oxoacyl-[acyl-carrier protein] reductase
VDNIRSAVITGGTQGLGRSLSLEFAKAGYSITATFHTDANAASELESQIKSQGKSCRCLKLDASLQAPDWDLNTKWDEIVLINNAVAAFFPKPLHLLSWEDFEQQISVTVKGSFLALQSLYRLSKTNARRTVVNVLSRAAIHKHKSTFRGALPYLMAKQALLQMSQIWAAEQMPPGMRIICVSPGYMETSLTEPWPETLKDGLKKENAFGPDVVAQKIRELVEDPNVVGRGENYEV